MDQKQTVLDIAMNLNRIGNWVADGYDLNKKKIDIFINNTDGYIREITDPASKFKKTWSNFLLVYPSLRKNPQQNAENLMTWGNILTHRSKLI